MNKLMVTVCIENVKYINIYNEQNNKLSNLFC